MSRTWKTDPLQVQMWRGFVARVARCDHTDGVCDLPSTYREEVERGGWIRPGQCRWDFVYTGHDVCCCAMCRDQKEATRKAKQERYATRAALRRLLKSPRLPA